MEAATHPPSHVDVVIPLHNAAAYIEEAVRSVLGQTVLPRTLTVVDDGSTDNGAERMRALINENLSAVRIQLIQQPNQGPNAARNTGIANGTAPYVALLDADDVWEPMKLEHQLACMERPAAEPPALVYCACHVVDEAGKPRNDVVPDPPRLRGHVFSELLFSNRVSGSASGVLLRRAVLERTGPFDEELRGSEDWDMWLRIAQYHALDFVDRDLVAIRFHDRNAQRDVMEMLWNMLRFYMKWFPFAKKNKVVCREWGHLIAEFTRRSVDPDAALALVNATLSREQRQYFFARTLGSLRGYLLLKRISAMRRKSQQPR